MKGFANRRVIAGPKRLDPGFHQLVIGPDERRTWDERNGKLGFKSPWVNDIQTFRVKGGTWQIERPRCLLRHRRTRYGRARNQGSDCRFQHVTTVNLTFGLLMFLHANGLNLLKIGV